MHVHSTWSDGRDSLEQNVEAAVSRGLLRMACVDHVRKDTDWVPRFVEAVRAVDATTSVELLVGVEAKLLDGHGHLDTPSKMPGVDLIYIADHQVPWCDSIRKPADVRRELQLGHIQAETVIEWLARSTISAIRRYPGSVIAHLFSVLPKVGISEDQVPFGWLDELAYEAARQHVSIEIDERWRCPSPRVVAHFSQMGVPVLASTDSHRSDTIGRYQYVQRAMAEARLLVEAGHA